MTPDDVQQKRPPKFYLGIDGGGSKTYAVVLSESGAVVSEGMGGPSNSFHNSADVVSKSAGDAVRQAISGLPAPVTSVASVAAIGIPAQDELRRLLPHASVYWIGERPAALSAAGVSPDRGVVIVAGTGSSFQAVDGERSISVGGWGSLLGDEGSGYDIALQGIRRAIRAIDGRAAPTLLAEMLAKRFGLPADEPFRSAITIARASRHDIASFSRDVSDAARKGDEAAKEIIGAAARSLASDGLYVAGKLFGRQDSFPVVLSGGVFGTGELIVAPIRDAFADRFPNAHVKVPEVPPAVGAARLAMHPEKHSAVTTAKVRTK